MKRRIGKLRKQRSLRKDLRLQVLGRSATDFTKKWVLPTLRSNSRLIRGDTVEAPVTEDLSLQHT